MAKTSRDAVETSLQLISNVETIVRVRPPKELNKEQRAIFEATVAQVPADWFNPSNIPTLVQYSRHLAVARRIDQAIERCLADENFEQLESLLKTQRAESKVILSLATSLRLTPRSTQPKNVSISKLYEKISPWRGRPLPRRIEDLNNDD